MLMLLTAVTHKEPGSQMIRDSSTYRNSYQSILKPVNKDVDTTQGVEVGVESLSHIFQEHIPCGFAYMVVSSVDPKFS